MRFDQGNQIGHDFDSVTINFNGLEYIGSYTILDIGRHAIGSSLAKGTPLRISKCKLGFGGFGRPTERWKLPNLPNQPTAADTRLEIQFAEADVTTTKISDTVYSYAATFDLTGVDNDAVTELMLCFENEIPLLKSIIYPQWHILIMSALSNSLAITWTINFE